MTAEEVYEDEEENITYVDDEDEGDFEDEVEENITSEEDDEEEENITSEEDDEEEENITSEEDDEDEGDFEDEEENIAPVDEEGDFEGGFDSEDKVEDLEEGDSEEEDNSFVAHHPEGTTTNAEMPRSAGYERSGDQDDAASSGIADRTMLTSDSYVTYRDKVKLQELLLSVPLKESRKESRLGLSQSVKEYGILQPIHVMKTEVYDDWLNGDQEHVYTGAKYLLLDGFRRVSAGLRNKLEEAEAVIWDFKDKEYGQDVHVVLHLMLNKTQKRTWTEIWGLFQHLEEKYAMSPGTLEYLLSLEGGQAMKLKDIMSCDFPEVVDDLVCGKKTVDQAYNALQKARKELDQGMVEDGQSISSIEDAADMASDVTGGEGQLSDDDVQDLLELGKKMGEEELEEGDFDDVDLAEGAEGVNKQSSKERERLEPQLRQAVLIRDKFRCFCCDTGGTAFASALVIHHKVPVSCDGPDTMDNLVTLCQSCHLTLEAIAIAKCRLHMPDEERDALNPEEKARLIKVLNFAKLVYEAHKRKNLKIQKTPHGAPWAADVKSNMKSAAQYAADKYKPGTEVPEDLDDGVSEINEEDMMGDYEDDN